MMPTELPLAAASVTVFAALLTSMGSVGNALLTAIVKFAVVAPPMPVLDWTVIVWLVAVSKSSKVPAATVTTPVVALIANRPPALFVRL